MRKLILQMQTSVDCLVCDGEGTTDGFVWNWGPEWTWDEALQGKFIELKKSIDCILLSRKMAEEGFIDYWHEIAVEDSLPASRFAASIDAAEKVVFSRSPRTASWPRTRMAGKTLTEEIRDLKARGGKNMIAYGGAEFAAALLRSGEVDEVKLFINPIAFGRGKNPFEGMTEAFRLRLARAEAFPCGVLVAKFEALH